jgi:hypothetical protein
MKNLILTFILLWLNQQLVFGQCGAATNLSHQFTNGINTFSWDQVPDATQYELWVQDSGGYGWELLTTTTNNVFLTPGGVLSGSYEFYISVTFYHSLPGANQCSYHQHQPNRGNTSMDKFLSK